MRRRPWTDFRPGVFGLAVVDQTLPGRSGLELAARLREQDQAWLLS